MHKNHLQSLSKHRFLPTFAPRLLRFGSCGVEPRNLLFDKLPGVAAAGPHTWSNWIQNTCQGQAGGEGAYRVLTPRGGDGDGVQTEKGLENCGSRNMFRWLVLSL